MLCRTAINDSRTSSERWRVLRRNLLSKELKELEINEFVTRTVYPTTPVLVEYELTDYSASLEQVISSLSEWGIQHAETHSCILNKVVLTYSARLN